MRGTRAVRFGRETVFAQLTLTEDAVRLRVSADECDRLDLFAGKQVPLAIEDGGQHTAQVVGVRREPPFAWVAVEFPARSRAAE